MNASHLLEQARALGIVLTGDGGKLRYEAPAGRLTAELRQSLSAHKAAILDLLEAERMAARRIVQCRDCVHHIPSPLIRRASGAIWDMPGGCIQAGHLQLRGLPFTPGTGWYCDGWTSKTMH